MKRHSAIAAGMVVGLALWATTAAAQSKHYRFAYEQPHSTGFGISADVFAAKLSELSHGTMVVDQFPAAQLGSEPQALQLVKSGDIDFTLVSTANSATLSPEAGVLSLHYLFPTEAILIRSISNPALVAAVRKMFDDTVTGAHALAIGTLGLREFYGASREVHGVDDTKGVKVRVQATATEDELFAAYGAQTVHMPFGSVYTSLQTGVVQLAENGLDVYAASKHYEVAPVVSMSNHEANDNVLWVSDKLWQTLSVEQRGWVQAAADEVARVEPPRAIELEHKARARLTALGVKFVEVDISGFVKIAAPIEDAIAAKLGPHAVEVLRLSRAVRE